MFEIKGKYTTAKIWIDELEESAIGQVVNFVNHPAFTNPVAIMPDAHYGKGAVIGFTMEMTDRIIPGVIGVDIGCGILGLNLGKTISMPLSDIDIMIRAKIPFGTGLHDQAVLDMEREFDWKGARVLLENFSIFYQKKFGLIMDRTPYSMSWFVEKCNKIGCNIKRGINSLGTLGSGNHYQELGISSGGDYWLTIHSGSRNFGKCVCDYWQGIARKRIREDLLAKRQEEMIRVKEKYQGDDRYHKIQEIKNKYGIGIDTNGLEWLEGQDAGGYLRDMIFAQLYASTNRGVMAQIVSNILKLDPLERIDTVHNYINFQDGIIRKGAVRANEKEKFLLPFNMRDGVLLCSGRGAKEWNSSSPHGCGRSMSRGQAKKSVDLETFRRQMEGIYSTSVGKGTLDEAPDAYKNSEVIESAIKDTAIIIDRIKPVLNLKDSLGNPDDLIK